MKIGAKGYILKTMASAQLIYAIDEVAAGKVYLPSVLSSRFFDYFQRSFKEETNAMDKENLLADLTSREEEVLDLLQCKKAAYPSLDNNELLFGIVNNQIGRAIFRRAAGDVNKAAQLVKAFPLDVKGSLDFDYAQVTKGGVPLNEVDENLQSKYTDGLYFAGEILDVDGACGGYNLQWAFSSACTVADGILSK